MQEVGLLPWFRSLVPFVCINDQLAQVPGFWIAADFAADEDEESLLIDWDRDMSFLRDG